MMKRFYFYAITAMLLAAACSDDETFTTNKNSLLEFTTDTVSIDTLFSTVPSATAGFWVHNRTSKGIRLTNVRLERGNQSGFRVNVDGMFVNPVASGIEIRSGDSIRVFVEVTTRANGADQPQLVQDNLIFSLQSGAVQSVNLRTWSWDALLTDSMTISRDTTIETTKPLVVTNRITVSRGATLTIRNTTVYFHQQGGMTVNGTLKAENCTFRGDRLDHMFDYLPYDRVSGQWQGIIISAPPTNIQVLNNCELRNATNAIIADSSTVALTECKIHNSRGHGIKATNSTVMLSYCQLTNTLGDCLDLEGGQAVIDHCTLAQFYPFTANRGAALRFTNTGYGMLLKCTNTLVTGYEADVVMGEQTDTAGVFDYFFSNCILRTDSVDDKERFENVVWEKTTDSIQGKKHFVEIDEQLLRYNFSIDSLSPALRLGIGCTQ